jgi:cell division protease FtsH
MNTDQQRQTGGTPGRQNIPGPPNLWRNILWFLVILFLISLLFNPFQASRVNISYSAFKEQVSAGNVKNVLFSGNDITGEFRKNYAPGGQDSTGSAFKFFATIKPAISDPGLIDSLQAKNVEVSAESTDSPWIGTLILFVPWLLILGYFFYVRRKMQGQMGNMMSGGLFNIGKSKAKRFRMSRSSITFRDVAGLENAKRDLQEIIDYMREPSKFTSLGADIPKGVLLMGSPGTGKTLLSRATAGEAGVPFYSISGSEFIEMFVGVGASRVRDLFENAKKNAPSIIFIDEIDSVGRARGTGLGGGHDEREQTLNQILSEMDGFEPNQSVVVMAATNRPDVLDPALIRPGRFDRQITLELPQKGARLKILEIHTRRVPLAGSVNLKNIAARTVGFSGADLKNLVNEAALLAGRQKKVQVDMDDFDEARDKILLGAEREEKISDEEKRVVAFHEAGHALLAKLLPTDPLAKVTIIPRGRALGATEQMPESDRHNLKREYLLNRIAVALGGRAAEIIAFNEITNGAASDLKAVTKLARKMVCQWGMSDRLGPVMFRLGEDHVFLGREMAQEKDFSESTARVIDEEIQRIVSEGQQKAIGILTDNRESLNALAEALLEHETLDNEDVDRVLRHPTSRKRESEAAVPQ